MNAEERAAIKARAEAATYVGGDVQELAEDTLALLGVLEVVERDHDELSQMYRSLIKVYEAVSDVLESAEAKLAAVGALEPTWTKGCIGCHEDMFSRSTINAALTMTTTKEAQA